MQLVSVKILHFFVITCSAQFYTTVIATTTAELAETTTAAPYCDAEKCERHGVIIRDLEQKVNDLLIGFEVLNIQNEELKSDNEEIKAKLKDVQIENIALRDDISYLQGPWLF